MPRALLRGGNARAWTALRTAVLAGRVVVLHGPVGSGKTFGWSALLAAMRCAVVDVDACTPLPELQSRLAAATGGCIRERRKVLVVEDADALSAEAAKLLDKALRDACTAAIVLVCVDAWNLEVFRAFKKKQQQQQPGLVEVRLFAPRADHLFDVGRARFPHLSAKRVRTVADAARGNLTQLCIACRTGLPPGRLDVQESIFKRTERLLKVGLPADDLAEDPGAFARLLHFNYPSLHDDVERAAREAEALSRCDVGGELVRVGALLTFARTTPHYVPALRLDAAPKPRRDAPAWDLPRVLVV